MGYSIQNPTTFSVSTHQRVTPSSRVFGNETVLFKMDVEDQVSIIISRLRDLLERRSESQSLSNWNQECTISNILLTTIKDYLGQNENVEKILLLRSNNILHIWTVVSTYQDEAIRRSVYQQESLLMQHLSKHDFHFDFYLIELEEVGEVMASGVIVLYDKMETNHGKS